METIVASEILPVEIWETILHSTISAPLFLDPNALMYFKTPSVLDERHARRLADETTYWDAERHRNILRRVCKAWDAYLCGFNHRFVRMSDIKHKRVSDSDLFKAVRICFDPKRPCDLDLCQGECFARWSVYLWNVVDQNNLPQAQIIAGDCNVSDMAEIFSLFPHLKVVSNFLPTGDYTLKGPSFRNRAYNYVRTAINDHPIGSSSLTTLSLSWNREFDVLAFEEAWKLPTLKNFIFKMTTHRGSNWQAWRLDIFLGILAHIGASITSLYMDGRLSTIELPSVLWERCPKLEHLHTGLCLRHPPPTQHPLRSLGIPFTKFYRQEPFGELTIPPWPSIQTVIVDKLSWGDLAGSISGYPLTTWMDTCQERQIRLEDMNGVSVEETLKVYGVSVSRNGGQYKFHQTQVRT